MSSPAIKLLVVKVGGAYAAFTKKWFSRQGCTAGVGIKKTRPFRPGFIIRIKSLVHVIIDGGTELSVTECPIFDKSSLAVVEFSLRNTPGVVYYLLFA